MRSRFDELAEIWFKKAKEDFLWAENSFKGGSFGGACFICQQVAEKLLKAYLFSKRERLVRTHNLIELLKLARKHSEDFQKLYLACRQLNKYYTDTRYPDIWDITRFEDRKLAEEALKLAEEILEFVKKKI